MSAWWLEDHATYGWMIDHGFEPRAGVGVWMKEVTLLNDKGTLVFKIKAPDDYWNSRWFFTYTAHYAVVAKDMASLLRLEADATHFTAFEPLLEMLDR